MDVQVTVYGQPGCGQCVASKLALERAGIPYRYVDVQAVPGAREHVQELGYSSLPVFETAGEHWTAFRPDKIAALVR